MRIISGKYKNRELKSPNSKSTHPMGERERTAIFNMLTSHFGTPNLDGLVVLDLFAGTGALGIEALSRGAIYADFVENNPKALRCLKSNLEGIEVASVHATDAHMTVFDSKFDIIFIDPPYDQFDEEILTYDECLTDGGVMIVSSPKPLNETSRKYANCYITLVSK